MKKYARPSILGPTDMHRQIDDLREVVTDLYREAIKLHRWLKKVERRVGILEIQKLRKRLEPAEKLRG